MWSSREFPFSFYVKMGVFRVCLYAVGNEPVEDAFIPFNLVCMSNIRKLIDCITLSLKYYSKLIVHNTSIHV